MTLTESDLAKIRAAIGVRQRAAADIDRQVLRARDKGATWTEIGYALGITAQGAQKRYGTGSEREQAHKESQAASAVKRRLKAQKAPTRPKVVDPWPDGTVQDTIASE